MGCTALKKAMDHNLLEDGKKKRRKPYNERAAEKEDLKPSLPKVQKPDPIDQKPA